VSNSKYRISAAVLFLLLSFATANAQTTIGPFTFTPTNSSGALLGQVTVNGIPAADEDIIAAFDEDDNCVGAAHLIPAGELAYINLQVYGNDPITPEDEGMDDGELFTLRLYDNSADLQYIYPTAAQPDSLNCWVNTNGAPLPGDCGNPSLIYDFITAVCDVDCPASQAINEGEELTFSVSGSCPIVAEDLPAGGIFETGIFTWVPACDDAGVYVVRLIATDGIVADTCETIITVTDVPSELTATPPELAFQWQSGGPLPPRQLVGITNLGCGDIPFSAHTDVDWLQVDPADGMTPFELSIGIDIQYVQGEGSYYGNCIVTSTMISQAINDMTFMIPVTLVVQSGQTCIGPFCFTPTNSSGALLGQVTVNGATAEVVDVIAAFDSNGICAGAAYLIIAEGTAYANLQIYGDDPTTEGTDEGMNAGEPFTLRLYNSSEDLILFYPNQAQPESLYCWVDTHGGPLPSPCGDHSEIYDFQLCDCSGYCDLNGDGIFNPVDVVFIINYVYKYLDSRVVLPYCPGDNGDWDCDGVVNAEDVNWFIYYVYKNLGDGPCDPCACDVYPADCPAYP